MNISTKLLCANCSKYESENKKSYSNHRRWCLGKMKKESYLGINKGALNAQWKGNDVKYGALHDYIKYYFKKTSFCASCKTSPPFDVCNISGKYNRDLSDWEWLCRKCHMIKDGRLKKLILIDKRKRS